MSNLGNKTILSKNLKRYIEQSGKDRRELAEIWGFPYSTLTEWINGRKYPRIDRIEIMADYFGILKSDLIEEKTEEHRQMQKNNDIITDVVVKMRTDENFFSLMECLLSLDAEKQSAIKQMVLALQK
jgi:transcriptional regulator with XRE-family HTH domain